MSSGKSLAYVRWLLRNKIWINALAVLLALVAIAFASRLYLKPSFSALLPNDLPSVVQLNKVMDEVGGTGLLLIGIESPNFRANRKFADQLALELDKLPPGSIRDYEFNFKDTRDFFERFGLFYLKHDELLKLRDRLQIEVKEKAEKKKDQLFSSFLGLDDEETTTPEEEPKKETTNLLTEKMDPRVQRLLEYPGDYLASEDGHLVVIGVRIATSSLSVGEAQKLTHAVREIVNRLEPAKFHPELQVNFSGNVQRTIDEVNTVKHDIADTAILLVLLILGCLYLFFQSWKLVGLLVLNLCFALALTMGFAQIAIGYLNTITAFMSSLVVGTGINYSCILISRFLEERRKESGPLEAVAQAVHSTCLPTLVGSATTAISFIALFAAENNGFSDFALIGGVGILLCWMSAFTLMPLWIVALSKRSEFRKPTGRNALRLGSAFKILGDYCVTRPKTVAVSLFVFSFLSVLTAYPFLRNPYEYDFRKLGNKVSHSKTGASGLQKRIQEDVYKGSLTPAIVLLDNVEQGKTFCSEVRTKVENLPAEKRVFQGCLSLEEVLPSPEARADEGPAKAKLRSEVMELMGNKWLKYSDTKIADIMLNMHKKGEDHPPTVDEMPLQLKKRFRTLSGEDGRVAYIYPENSKPLELGENLLNYTQTFGSIQLAGGAGEVRAAGENFVLADLLRSIRIDGPKTSALAFFGVVLLVFFLAGGLSAGLLMMGCLTLATVWLFGLQALFDVKFNFLNFIALPLTFGIGVDYPINLYSRYREQGFRNFPEALRTTGVAVFLCCSTTIIGYFTLFVASNQALVSFAKLALIGEFTCLVAAFVALPVVLVFLKPRT